MAKAKSPTAEKVVVALLMDHLIDGISYKAGTPLQCQRSLSDILISSGIADGNEAAVAHLVSEGAPVFIHEPPEPEAIKVTDKLEGAELGGEE